ncbi:5b8e800e-8472-4394-ad96-587a785498e3 [Thermothielavioides terrestris]|uniref:5b8e800e-8472-4394-ad96-587a785498e3 n=1 Tax=Thermothielavioides terrestris TaxID=2587410 RepID=A0A446BP21_9PEZI|nr:5b8e800e-8472-4394-ad96-587a785498e3 [Thermothielavioides terrestris]
MYIHARDDPGTVMFSGLYAGGDGGKILMEGEWRNSSFAQFVKAPLENCHVLNETKLCRELGYAVGQLTWIARAVVAYGGLRSIGLQAGETVIISPATGGYGGSGAIVAAAMGARVIALGRNLAALNSLAALSPRIHVVQMSDDHEAEMKALTAFGQADAVLDLSPPMAKGSSHLTSCILSLRHSGRVSLMGGIGEAELPLFFIVRNDITLKGKLMYDYADIAGTFPLEQWEEAFDAAEKTRFDDVALLSAW